MSNNKKLILLISVSTLSFSSMVAMDLLLSLPFKGINKLYSFFQTRTVIEQTYLHTLPQDIQGKIIKDVFLLSIAKYAYKKDINQEALEKYLLKKTTVALGLSYINEFFELEKMCQKEIGHKKILAEKLFGLSKKEQDVFVRMANRSDLLDGNINYDDYQILAKMKQQDIIEDMYFEVPPANKTFAFLYRMQIVGIKMFVYSIPCVGGCIFVPKNSPIIPLLIIATCGSGVTLLCLSRGLENIFSTFYPQQQWKCEKRKGTKFKGYESCTGSF